MVTLMKPQLSCTKKAVVSELESVASHEEEALFGNLFAEARSTGVADSVEQPTFLGSVSSSSQHGPIQLAADLICFMKTCIFSPEWCKATYMDACRKFQTNHLEQFMSILNCQACLSDENGAENTSSYHMETNLLHINMACFELLQMFLVSEECPVSLREELVEKVLKVESGKYTYNHYTLALVTRAIISGTNSTYNLGRKVFVQYCDHLLEKANDKSSSSSSFNDFCEALPCAFHLEILLVAFHSTSGSEKSDLTKIVLSSVEKMKHSPPGKTASELTRWALVLSRLLLVLRHILLYPVTRPSWLFMRLRSRMRDIQVKEELLCSMNDCLPSFATVIVEGMLAGTVEEHATTSSLFSQLLDVAPVQADLYFDKSALGTLGLNVADLSVTILEILGCWRDMKPEVADDLIVERYVFLICWSTLAGIGYHGNDALLWNDALSNPDFANVDFFLTFALSVSDDASLLVGANLPAVAFGFLKFLHSEILLASNMLDTREFSRKGAWLSFILSLINTSVWKTQASEKADVDSYGAQSLLGKIFVTYISENSGHCLCVLSSLLETCLTFREAYLSLVDRGRPSKDHSYPSLLLKHSAFDKSKHHLLFEKVSSNMEMLERMCDLPSRIDGIRCALLNVN